MKIWWKKMKNTINNTVIKKNKLKIMIEFLKSQLKGIKRSCWEAFRKNDSKNHACLLNYLILVDNNINHNNSNNNNNININIRETHQMPITIVRYNN